MKILESYSAMEILATFSNAVLRDSPDLYLVLLLTKRIVYWPKYWFNIFCIRSADAKSRLH